MATFPFQQTRPQVQSGSHMAFVILYFGYICLPLVAGIDKFFNYLASWQGYLAPKIPQMLNLPAQQVMQIVGGVEIAAALVLLLSPRIGGYLVAFWLWGIIANLAMIGGSYDIMLRDFGLSLGALAVAQLARDNRL